MIPGWVKGSKNERGQITGHRSLRINFSVTKVAV